MKVWFFFSGFFVYLSVCFGAWRDVPLLLMGSDGPGQVIAVEQPRTSGFRESDLRVRYEFITADGRKHTGQAIVAPNSDTGKTMKLAVVTGQPVEVRYLAAYPAVSWLAIDSILSSAILFLLGLFFLAATVLWNIRWRRQLRQFNREVGARFERKTPDARYDATVEGGRIFFELFGRHTMMHGPEQGAEIGLEGLDPIAKFLNCGSPLILARGPEDAAVISLEGLDPKSKLERRFSRALIIAALFIGFPLLLDVVFLLGDPATFFEPWAVGLNLLLPPGIYLLFRHRRRSEWAVFSVEGGGDVFAVPRCGPDSSRWEDFVNTIERSIAAPPDPACSVENQQ